MADHANIGSPLVAGPTVKLESLFADWIYVPGRHRSRASLPGAGRLLPVPRPAGITCARTAPSS